MHDETLDRTTNGNGKISETTWNNIKKLDAGSWKNLKYYGVKVPLLQDIFDLCKGKCTINIDLKDTKIVPEMTRVISEFKMKDHVVITGKIPECTSNIRENINSITMFFESTPEFQKLLSSGEYNKAINVAIELAREHHLPGFLFHVDWITKEIVYQSHLHCLAINVYDVNTKESFEKAINAEVDGIMTDAPLLMKNLLTNQSIF